LQAIKVGYRLFDGAYDYQNEKEAGEGIRRALDEGIVKREDIFVTTKLWNNYHSKEHALPMMKKQNEAWGLGYIDLFLIHFPSSLEYVDPEKKRYPVSFSFSLPIHNISNTECRAGGWKTVQP
jgi:D-xylose reductase